jgi:serine/threonine protein kinase
VRTQLDNFVFESEASDAEVLLIDFGMAVLSPPGEMIEDGCSTLLYMAPEMFYLWHAHVAKTGGSVLYDHKVDVWALGVTIFQMLVGVLPFGLGDDPAEDEEETAVRLALTLTFSLTFTLTITLTSPSLAEDTSTAVRNRHVHSHS